MPALSEDEARRLGDAVVHTLQSGDGAPLAPFVADGLVVWHNHNRLEITGATDQDADPVSLYSLVRDLEVELLSLETWDDGIVIEYAMRGVVAKTHGVFEVFHCIVGAMQDGKLTRIREYLDPNYFAQLYLAPVVAKGASR